MLHRPRRPAAHARLRQEVPAEVGRQPDVRRLVDPRLLAAARVRPAARHRLARVLLAARRRLRPRQGAGVRRGPLARRLALPRRPARAAEAATRQTLFKKDGTVCHAANEIEGFLFKGRDAERHYHETGQVRATSRPAATTTRCPATRCAASSTRAAEVQRAMGFENEKDHPEVAPSQFEMNYSYTEVADRGRPDPALQAALPPGRAEHGPDRVLPAQAGHRRQRQRHAHQHVARRGRARTCSATRRARTALSAVRLGLHRPHPGQRDRHLPGAQRRASTRTAGSTRTSRRRTRSRPRPSTAARWSASRSATSARRASRSARSRPTRTRTWRIYTLLRTGLEGPRLGRERGDEAQPHALPARTTSTTRCASSRRSKFAADLLGEDVQRPYAELKQAVGRALPQAAGHAHQDRRGPVPPRGHEPVPLEHVLGSDVSTRVERARVQAGSCPFLFAHG